MSDGNEFLLVKLQKICKLRRFGRLMSVTLYRVEVCIQPEIKRLGM